jgi:integrase
MAAPIGSLENLQRLLEKPEESDIYRLLGRTTYPVYGVLLYAQEDYSIKRMREHVLYDFPTLFEQTGRNWLLVVFENLPYYPVQDFRPEEVYEVARVLGAAATDLPCIVFFTDPKERSETLVVSLSELLASTSDMWELFGFEALYVLALHCGFREGELLGLKWDDVDLSGGIAMLRVRRTLSETRTGHKFEKPKNGKGRSVKCSQKATEALRSHRKRQYEERLRMGSLWQDNGLVFPTTTGTTMSCTNLLGRHFKPLLKKAGLPAIRLHDLRHTCATILLMAGKHPKYVQELLGHASISITLDTFSHVIEGMDGGLADAMGETL